MVDLSIRETTSPTSPTGLAAKSSTLTTEIIVEDYLLAVEARSSLDPAQVRIVPLNPSATLGKLTE